MNYVRQNQFLLRWLLFALGVFVFSETIFTLASRGLRDRRVIGVGVGLGVGIGLGVVATY